MSALFFNALNRAIEDAAPDRPKAQPLVLERYDAGLLSGYGGGDVDWWQDYIRAELDRAHDFYQSQVDSASPAQCQKEGA